MTMYNSWSNPFARGATPDSMYHSPLINGVMKLKPTGEVDGFDIEVVMPNEELRFARPCFAFGSRMSVPDKEWLQKYADQIFLWVTFEDGELAFPVWIGFGILENGNLDWPDFPNADVYRTVKWQEVVNDSKNVYTFEQLNDDATLVNKTTIDAEGKTDEYKNYTLQTQEAINVQAQENVDVSGSNITNTAQQTVTLSGQFVKLGSTNANNPAVKGNELTQRFTELLTLQNEIIAICQTFGTSLAAAAASPPLTPIAAPASAFATQIAQKLTTVAQITGNLAQIISKKVTLE